MYELNPRWHYKVNGAPANLTRGAFNKSSTGAFLGYAHSIPETDVKVLIRHCPECQALEFWVELDELRTAEWVIECENCGEMLRPVEG